MVLKQPCMEASFTYSLQEVGAPCAWLQLQPWRGCLAVLLTSLLLLLLLLQVLKCWCAGAAALFRAPEQSLQRSYLQMTATTMSCAGGR